MKPWKRALSMAITYRCSEMTMHVVPSSEKSGLWEKRRAA
jgi:hypothetical protein